MCYWGENATSTWRKGGSIYDWVFAVYLDGTQRGVAGGKTTRNSCIPTVKRTSKLVGEQVWGQRCHPPCALLGNSRVFGQADQNVQIRRTAMVQTHQPGKPRCRSVLPEDIEGDIE